MWFFPFTATHFVWCLFIWYSKRKYWLKLNSEADHWILSQRANRICHKELKNFIKHNFSKILNNSSYWGTWGVLLDHTQVNHTEFRLSLNHSQLNNLPWLLNRMPLQNQKPVMRGSWQCLLQILITSWANGEGGGDEEK